MGQHVDAECDPVVLMGPYMLSVVLREAARCGPPSEGERSVGVQRISRCSDVQAREPLRTGFVCGRLRSSATLGTLFRGEGIVFSRGGVGVDNDWSSARS